MLQHSSAAVYMLQSNEARIVGTCDLQVGGECGVEDATPPVILVSEKENILNQGRRGSTAKWTVQTGLQERSPLSLQGPFAPQVTLKQHTH